MDINNLGVAIADRLATKTSSSPLTNATLFNWKGSIAILSITGRITTNIQNAAVTVKLSVTPDALAAYDICAAKSIQAFGAGSLISITGVAGDAAVATTVVGSIAPGQSSMVVMTCVTSGTLTVTYSTSGSLTGAIVWEVLWIPLNAAGTLAAA